MLNPLIVGLVAFITVARLLGRGRWGAIAVITVVAVSLGPITNGSSTVVVDRPVAAARLGGRPRCPLHARHADHPPERHPGGRRPRACRPPPQPAARRPAHRARSPVLGVHAQRQPLRVVVFDRDLEGAGVGAAAWRNLRLRTDPGSPGGFSMRAQLEHAALMSYAGDSRRRARARTAPRERGRTRLHPARLRPDPGHDLGRDRARGADRRRPRRGLPAVQKLHATASRTGRCRPSSSSGPDDGEVWLAGAAARHDRRRRRRGAHRPRRDPRHRRTADRPRRARWQPARGSSARRRSPRALPALQTVALSRDTRRRVRKDKKLLGLLREELVALRPSAAETRARAAPDHAAHAAHDRGRHHRRRTCCSASSPRSTSSGSSARPTCAGRWSRSCSRSSPSSGASLSLSGFVPEKLSHVRTFAAQLAAAFATLVSPPTVGAVAVNVRYLQRSGLHPALAAASVGVSQVFAFFLHITMLFVVGVAGGHQQLDRAAHRRAWAIWAVVGVVVVAGPAADVRPGAQDPGRPGPADLQRGRPAARHHRRSSRGRSSRAWAGSCSSTPRSPRA